MLAIACILGGISLVPLTLHGYAARVDPLEKHAEQRRLAGKTRHASGGL